MKTTLALTLGLLSLSAYAQSFLPRVGGETFQQVAEVTGTQVGDYFGYSVAVSGNTLVVGAPNAPDDVCGNCGAAYVYTAPDGDWAGLTQVATLTPPAGQSIPGGFGYPVAISGDTIAVGGVNPAGEAITYVYVDPAGNATATGELTTTVESGGQINGIAIDGGTVAVSMPYASIGTQRAAGSVFVYVEPLGGWANMTQTAQLAFKGVEDIDFFGASVGVSGRYIAVGATQVKVGGLEQGAAYLFVEPAAGWSGAQLPTTEFEASNGTRKAAFGASISVSGDTVAIGAPDETVGSSQDKGAVYMFTRPSTGWPTTMTETAELTAGTGGSVLGWSVALSGQTLVAGAPFEHAYQGFAYVFSEPSGGWQNGAQGKQIAASDGAANDYFGYSVSFSGGMIAAGAIGWPGGNPLSEDGAAYVFGESSQ